VSKAKKIILVQGANLTYLGKREPEIYGRTTPEELDATLLEYAKRRVLIWRFSIQMWKARRSTEFTAAQIKDLMAW